MLTIRLQRTGRKNSPQFRLVLIEKRSAAKSSAKEIFGSYNPKTKQLAVPHKDRLDYWISQRVPLSPSANNLLVGHQMISGVKVSSFSIPKKAVGNDDKNVKPSAMAVPDKVEDSEAVVAEIPMETSAVAE